MKTGNEGGIFKRLLQFFTGFKQPEPPKWRLVPDERGTYKLEKYHPNINKYLTAVVGIETTEQADEYIRNLERPIIPRYDD